MIIRIGRQIVVTSKDTTSDIAGIGNARARMRSDVADNIFTWDDIFHLQFVIVRFGTVRL